MPNPFGAPELAPKEVARRIANGEPFVWLDVRESNEHALVRITNEHIHLLPLSRLASEQLRALPADLDDKDISVVVMCHHGIRSAQVVVWLRQHGWNNVFNLAGGIEAWAQFVDPTIGTY